MTKARWREIGLHALGWLVTLTILWFHLGLQDADFSYPIALFAWGDGTYYGALVKILLETGWVFHHPDLGAPTGLDLYDFAHFDALHLLIMKLIGCVTTNWARVLNVYYLLTYLLATSTALALFRHFGMRSLLALALALLFSLQPYHLYRAQGHIMLSGYYLLPLQAFAMLWLLSPLGLRDAEGTSLWRSRRFQFACGIAFLAVFAGHYYTAFGCMACGVAAVYSGFRLKSWQPVVQVALLYVVVPVGFALNLAPNFAYWAREGSNREVSAKHPRWVERYSFNMAVALLPVTDHRVEPLRQMQEEYTSTTPLAYSEQVSIGLVAGAGLVLLLGVGLFAGRKEGDVVPGLGAVAVGLVLFATLSGFGTIFAHLVTPQLHGLNRISIFLALLGLLSLGLLATPLLARMRTFPAQAVVVLVATLGLLDVIPSNPMYPPKQMGKQFEPARKFARQIQAAVPAGTLIHQVPSFNLPFGPYRQLTPYLFSRGLRWTSPGMLNRQAAMRNREAESLPAEQFLERLAIQGVGGLVLEMDGKTPLCDEAAGLLDRAGVPSIKSEAGSVFYDLRAYSESVRSRYSDEEVGRKQFEASTPVWATCKEEFLFAGPVAEGSKETFYWSTKPAGRLELHNGHTKPVRAVLSLRLHGGLSIEDGFEVSFGKLAQPIRTKGPKTIEVEMVVPPGRHPVDIAFRGTTPLKTPHGPRWYRLEAMRFGLAPSGAMVIKR